MLLNWIKLNYIYLIITAVLGFLMRATFLGISLPYEHLLHTHSHIAFLGWVYPTLFILLINFFLPDNLIAELHFKPQLIITHVLIFGMLISFLYQGYGVISIICSSLFQFMNYWFVFSLLKALKKSGANKSVAHSFLRISLWALFISTFGPWAVAFIKAAGYGDTNAYKMAIYFYLHFQYNGWIIFALFALFFKKVEDGSSVKVNTDSQKFFFYTTFALIPAYFLSLLGMYKESWNFSLAALSALLQIYALFFFVRFIVLNRTSLNTSFSNGISKILVLLVLSSFCLKILLQLLSVIPDLNDLAFLNRNVIIAFIHLIMLGIISSYLLVVLENQNILNLKSIISKIAVFLFVAGFTGTEILLGFQFTGWFLDNYLQNLSWFTGTMTGSIILLFPAFWFSVKSGKQNN